MGRRYLFAFLISLLILIAYPYYLKWIGVTQSEQRSYKEIPEKVQEAPQPPPLKEKPIHGETFSFQNELYDILFTNRGGSILSLTEGETSLYEAGPEGQGIFGVRILNEDIDLSQEIFTSETAQKRNLSPRFSYEKAGQYRVSKSYFIGMEKPTLVLEIEIENLSQQERTFRLEIPYGMNLNLPHPQDEAKVRIASFSNDTIHWTQLGTLKKNPVVSEESIDWHGLTEKYFAVLVKPEIKITGQENSLVGNQILSTLRLSSLVISPGGKKSMRLLIYAGPQKYETLKEVGLGFEKIFSQGFLGPLKVGILKGLKFFYRLTKNYGVAILLITLLIKLLFTPLTHFSYQSMGKMQALQPKIKALQKQHQNDPGRMNKEMMELYRRNRVNPLGGCLPLVLQIPIFIAFYQVLADAAELKGADFIFWMHDLSEPDRLFTFPTTLPFVGNAFNLLPILMIGSMLWQQKLTPQATTTPAQEKIMYFMPIIFGFVFYNLPSGLVLYWLVNNLLTIFHQLVIKRIPVILHHEDSE
ncbi:MAG: YidC/Oxa1 family insertase periplasmic-domain containing protein [Candidatus Omnitrophica bacterium]|nr:YidC/Oxa1 family insertase periplasmic-domain containing protein [Candidatus Omnitrophota bacterium]